MTIRSRYLFTAFVCFLLSPAITISAQKSKDNTISVSGLTLKEIKKALADNDFFLANSDEENKTCFTAPRAMPDSTDWSAANIQFFIRIKDSVALLSAKVELAETSNNFDVNFRGLKKGLNMQAFLYLDFFAKSFGKPVTYSRR